jgi:hypothetical protein
MIFGPALSTVNEGGKNRASKKVFFFFFLKKNFYNVICIVFALPQRKKFSNCTATTNKCFIDYFFSTQMILLIY